MRFRKVDTFLRVENNQPVLQIFGRGEDGKKYKHKVYGLRSYFYVSEDPHQRFSAEKLVKTRAIRSGFRSVYNTPLWEIETQLPSDTNELREGLNHYEADIHWVERACIDLKLTDGYHIDGSNMVVAGDNVNDIPLRTWVVDVEIITDPKIFATYETPQYQTACVVVWDSYTKEQYVFESKTISEETMWEGFLNLVKEHDPDIISGWHVEFDIGWIISRLDYLKINPKRLSSIYRAGVRHWTSPDGRKITKFEIAGTVVFDALSAYQVKKNPSGRLSSYNLHSVAKTELDVEWEDLGSKIQETWEKDYKAVLEYCKKDVQYETEILTKENLIEQALAVAKLSGCTLPQTTSKEQIIDHALLLRRGTRILPSKVRGRDTTKERESKVKGGLVLVPPPGAHLGVGVFDAAALYPSIITGFNISPETKNKSGTIIITDEIGTQYRFVRSDIQKGIMPETIAEFRALRENVRAQKREAEKIYGHDSKEYKALEELDTADKFIITSFYGVMAFGGFRLFDPDCANAITAVWRILASGLVKFLATNGYDAIYGDTDSMFVKLGTVDNGFKVKDLIQEFLAKELVKMGVGGTEIDVKFEKYFEKIAFKQREIKRNKWQAVKKKYVGVMTWSEGQSCRVIYVRGFETRRSDTASYLKTSMDKFFEMWLKESNEEGALKYLRAQKDLFKTLPPFEIAIPRHIHKVVESSPWVKGVQFGRALGFNYDQDTAPRLLYLKRAPNVNFSKGLNTSGELNVGSQDVICIQKNMILPSNFEIDYDLMFEKVFRKKFEPIIQMMGKQWDDIMEDIPKLDQWFS